MNLKTYRFREFELKLADGELRKGSSSVRLQEKPLLLLLTLLENPQTLVTRDQLRQRMWDSETYVDYEQGINVAVKKVRDALGDSADGPVFIQTVAKKGYRFLIPVELIETPETAPPHPSPLAPAETSVSRAVPRTFVRFTWGMAALAAVLLITLGARLLRPRPQHQPRPIRSVAILPLKNLSPDPGQDYFADGITEELITDLAQSLSIKVISRTSVMRYRQSTEPINQIAQDLGVDAIVEGAVARSGKRITVTVHLIDATEDRHLWARTYDRNAEDILAVEADLSQEIASQVGGALAPNHQVKQADYRAVDSDVYDLCMWGRYFWNKRTPAGLLKSIAYFQQAIERDPDYAPAYAGLANSYVILPSYDSVAVDDSLSKGRLAAIRAIDLDPNLADAHLALAFIALNHWMKDRELAAREFSRALQINPNSSTAHHWFSFYQVFAGNMRDAVMEMERARQLDPLSAIINADEGHLLYAVGRNEEARVRLRNAIELAPDLGQPHETLAFMDLAEGDTGEAIHEARSGLQLDSGNPRTIAEAGYVLAVTGNTAEARRMLVRILQFERKGSAYPDFTAMIYLGLGERDQAMNIIARSETIKSGAGVRGLRQWPIFTQLDNDPRYQKLIAAARE